MATELPRKCVGCKCKYNSNDVSRKYCSDKCRQKTKNDKLAAKRRTEGRLPRWLTKSALNIHTKRCTRCELLFVSSSRAGKICLGCAKMRTNPDGSKTPSSSCALTNGLIGNKIKIEINKIWKRKIAQAREQRYRY